MKDETKEQIQTAQEAIPNWSHQQWKAVDKENKAYKVQCIFN